jgi:hypothetical protein
VYIPGSGYNSDSRTPGACYTASKGNPSFSTTIVQAQKLLSLLQKELQQEYYFVFYKRGLNYRSAIESGRQKATVNCILFAGICKNHIQTRIQKEKQDNQQATCNYETDFRVGVFNLRKKYSLKKKKVSTPYCSISLISFSAVTEFAPLPEPPIPAR